jgi:hypothetical protein
MAHAIGFKPSGDHVPETIVGIGLALTNLRAVHSDQRSGAFEKRHIQR